MQFIIKSKNLNWDGKGFSVYPAKIYPDFEEAAAAISAYHFWENGEPAEKYQSLEFIPLNEEQIKHLEMVGLIRY